MTTFIYGIVVGIVLNLAGVSLFNKPWKFLVLTVILVLAHTFL